MALKPTDLKHCTPNDLTIADQMEKEIDKAMQHSFTNVGGTFQIKEGATQGAIREIQHRYQRAGWLVEYHSDQREGSWLAFKLPQPCSRSEDGY